jgi:type I restriction enzyme S subunit
MATIIGRGITPKYADNGDFLVINQRCVRDGRISLEYARHHDSSKRTVKNDKIIHLNDILINSTGVGTLGRTAPVQSLPGKLTADSHLTIVRPLQSVHPKWLAYAISFAEPTIEAMAEGSTGQTELSRQRLALLELPLPPLDVQRAIATTLGSLDDKIESNKRLIINLKLLLDSYSGKVSEELPVVTLKDIANSQRKTINPSKLGKTKVDLYSLPAFDADARPEYVSAATIMSNKFQICESSILLSRLNPRINRTWWVEPDIHVPALASTEFLILTTQAGANPVELSSIWLAVRDRHFRDELRHRVTGTSGSHQRVRPEDVMTIDVPDFSKISAILKETVFTLLQQIEQLRIESDRLVSLRDTLLPELLSGQIRVSAQKDEGAAV